MGVLVWKYKLRDNQKYYIKIEHGMSVTHKYSIYALERLKEILDKNTHKKDFLSNLSREYEKRNTE